MTPVTLLKGDALLENGEVCDAVYFIDEGISRMFYFNDEAKEFTCQIAYHGASNFIDNFTTDFTSLVTQSPSPYTIESLEDSQLFKNIIGRPSNVSASGSVVR